MLRVTVEIIPGGVCTPQKIATIDAWNVSGLAPMSDYQFRVDRVLDGQPFDGVQKGLVFGHDREDGALELCRKLFTAIVEQGT